MKWTLYFCTETGCVCLVKCKEVIFVVNWCNIDELKWYKLNKGHEFYNSNNLYMIHSLVFPFQNKTLKKNKKLCVHLVSFVLKLKLKTIPKLKKQIWDYNFVSAPSAGGFNFYLALKTTLVISRATSLRSTQHPHIALWHLLQISAVLFLLPLFWTWHFLWTNKSQTEWRHLKRAQHCKMRLSRELCFNILQYKGRVWRNLNEG